MPFYSPSFSARIVRAATARGARLPTTARAIKAEQERGARRLPTTARAIEAEQERETGLIVETQAAVIPEAEVPRLVRGPLYPIEPSNVQPAIAIDKPPEGTQSSYPAGGYYTEGGVRVPYQPGAPMLISVAEPGGPTTFWMRTDTGHYIRTDRMGNPVIPGDTRYHTDEQLREIREQLGGLAGKEGREQFTAAQEIGLVPQDAVYLESDKGWGYISGKNVREQVKVIQERTKAMAEQAKYDAAVNAVKPYKLPMYGETILGVLGWPKDIGVWGYDLVAAVKENKVPDSQLVTLFGRGEVRDIERAVKVMGKYENPDGSYRVLDAVKDGVPPETLGQVTSPWAVDWAMRTKQVAEETGVALPGEIRWRDAKTGGVITNEQFKRLIEKYEDKRDRLIKEGKMYSGEWFGLDLHPEDAYTLAIPEVKRKGVGVLSQFAFLPSRVLLPEVERQDIAKMEYAIGAAQIATWALFVLPKGVAPVASGFAGGVFGYSTVKNWQDMPKWQRALSVAVTAGVSIPAIMSIRGSFKAVKVPVAGGKSVVVWRGLSLRGRPIIGISRGKVAVGTKGITYPEFTEIVVGYRPTTKVEMGVLAVEKALREMGASEEAIRKIGVTLRDTKGFAGKKSPYLEEIIQPEATKTLSVDGVVVVLTESQKMGRQIRMIYGSTTMRPQLEPTLRQWRMAGDIDIQTGMNQADTATFAQRLLLELQKVEGKARVRIQPKNPTLIEVKGKDGQWHHAVDIHSEEMLPGSPEAVPEAAYGIEFARPAVTVKYPGVGTLRLMRLSETGVRKMSSILEWRAGEVGPVAHRGKDLVDYYVILRTFKGIEAADDWARAFGLDPAELGKLAMESPPIMVGWELAPSTGMRGPFSITINMPDMVRALSPATTVRTLSQAATDASVALKASPALATAEVSPSLASVNIESSPLAASASPVTSKALRSVGLPSVGVGYALSYPSVPSKPVSSRKISPSSRPSRLVSPVISVPVSPKVSPPGSPPGSPPSVPPSTPVSPPHEPPVALPSTPPSKKRPPVLPSDDKKKKVRAATTGQIAWRQGSLKIRGKLRPQWYVINPPYKSEKDVVRMFETPVGAKIVTGPQSAYKTIQQLGGNPEIALTLDMGIMDVKIRTPKGKRGRASIRFKPDVKQKTKSMVRLKEVKTS